MARAQKAITALMVTSVAAVVIADAYQRNPEMFDSALSSVKSTIEEHIPISKLTTKTNDATTDSSNGSGGKYIYRTAGDLRSDADIAKDQGHFFENSKDLANNKTLSPTIDTEKIALSNKINPKFSRADDSTSNNCPFTSIATILRAKGYDVAAVHASNGADTAKLVRNIFGVSEDKWSTCTTDRLTSTSLTQALAKVSKGFPPNSNGIISINLTNYTDATHSFGHAFNWWTDANGVLRLSDSQTGNGNRAQRQWLMTWATSGEAIEMDMRAVRLDDAQVNLKYAVDCVRKTYS